MRITNGCRVELEYSLLDENGKVLESSDEDGALVYVHGQEELPPSLERALEGHQPGDSLEVNLAPGEAFGPWSADGIVSVPRDEIPPDVELVPGDVIEVHVEREEGDPAPEVGGGIGDASGELQMRILDVSADAVVLDANHPLAEEAVTFKIEVLAVREGE